MEWMNPRIKLMIWNTRKKTQSEQQEENFFKKWVQTKKPLNNFKHTNIQIIGVPEGEEKEQ